MVPSEVWTEWEVTWDVTVETESWTVTEPQVQRLGQVEGLTPEELGSRDRTSRSTGVVDHFPFPQPPPFPFRVLLCPYFTPFTPSLFLSFSLFLRFRTTCVPGLSLHLSLVPNRWDTLPCQCCLPVLLFASIKCDLESGSQPIFIATRVPETPCQKTPRPGVPVKSEVASEGLTETPDLNG